MFDMYHNDHTATIGVLQTRGRKRVFPATPTTNETTLAKQPLQQQSQPTLLVVPPCVLQSFGGSELDDQHHRPYWEGAHATGDFSLVGRTSYGK
eukprot:scaffold19245_cov199-Amphora_coffeaeformis.AAC.25